MTHFTHLPLQPVVAIPVIQLEQILQLLQCLFWQGWLGWCCFLLRSCRASGVKGQHRQNFTHWAAIMVMQSNGVALNTMVMLQQDRTSTTDRDATLAWL